MLSAIIIDDDFYSRKLIDEILISNFPNIVIIGETGLLYEGINIIRALKPDLIFLDIGLPDGLGFQIYNLINNSDLKIIFITAYKEYAIDVINYLPAGYVLKPINIGKFIEIISNFLLNCYGIKNDIDYRLHLSQIVIKTTEKIHILAKNEIIRCEAIGNYTNIYLSNGEKILSSHTLKTFENRLTFPQFLRVHQSHLINSDYIKTICKPNKYLTLSNNKIIPISNRKKNQIIEYLKDAFEISN